MPMLTLEATAIPKNSDREPQPDGELARAKHEREPDAGRNEQRQGALDQEGDGEVAPPADGRVLAQQIRLVPGGRAVQQLRARRGCEFVGNPLPREQRPEPIRGVEHDEGCDEGGQPAECRPPPRSCIRAPLSAGSQRDLQSDQRQQREALDLGRASGTECQTERQEARAAADSSRPARTRNGQHSAHRNRNVERRERGVPRKGRGGRKEEQSTKRCRRSGQLPYEAVEDDCARQGQGDHRDPRTEQPIRLEQDVVVREPGRPADPQLAEGRIAEPTGKTPRLEEQHTGRNVDRHLVRHARVHQRRRQRDGAEQGEQCDPNEPIAALPECGGLHRAQE
jgi:ribosomal protein L37E